MEDPSFRFHAGFPECYVFLELETSSAGYLDPLGMSCKSGRTSQLCQSVEASPEDPSIYKYDATRPQESSWVQCLEPSVSLDARLAR